MMVPQIQSQTQKSGDYWWLGLSSPFGGRNYNLEEIQRGDHISNSSRFSRVGGGQRRLRKISKRQTVATEDESLLEEVFGNDDAGTGIDLNEIETECPRLSNCAPRFFCQNFRGRTAFDQIPCLLTSGQFAGEFGICCKDAYPRVCPALRRPPPPGQCLPRPLGQPADHECGAPGTRDTCVGADSLCCFNGCLNVCLPEPPYSVQRAYFMRGKAFVVSTNLDSSQPNNESVSGGDIDQDDEDDEDFTDLVNPRELRSRELEEESDRRRLSRILTKLIHSLRHRIS